MRRRRAGGSFGATRPSPCRRDAQRESVDWINPPPEPGDRQDYDDEWHSPLALLLRGVFDLDRFGQLLRGYTAFSETPKGLVKRIAKPHQYFAVTSAVGHTVRATRGDGRIGVVWHTQGSGKSMEMELYAAAVHREPALGNPTIIVITDRTELDGQLHRTFAASTIVPETPVQITSRAQLREALTGLATGGIFFTTLQKFGLAKEERDAGLAHPTLTDRHNVLVVVDEAHRSHYDDLDGYARHLHDALPNASFIAFTGTPIAQGERDTRHVFGDDIDVYDLTRAVEDGATVPVYFEPRHIVMRRAEGVTDEDIDAAADEATLDLDDIERRRVEAAVARINEVYGHPDRIRKLVADLLAHWDQRKATMRATLEVDGKAMVVAATREIAACIYEEVVRQRRQAGDDTWHSDALDGGKVKVIVSGSASDTGAVAAHVRKEHEQKSVKARVKAADDPLEIVIVKDMFEEARSYDVPADPAAWSEEIPAHPTSVSARYRKLAGQLNRAWSIGGGSETLAERIADFRFHSDVRVLLAKQQAELCRASGRPVPEEVERLLRSLIAEHTGSGEVVDIYAAAGIDRPDLTRLTPAALDKIRQTKSPHLAIEALRAALLADADAVTGGNIARERQFSQRLAELMNRYLNAHLTAAEIIEELIQMAKDIAAEARRGEQFDPPLDRRQLATYDALATNESADLIMGQDTLAKIARELVDVVRRGVKTDWTVREDVRAKLRSSIKRLLVKYDYPPDQQQEAIARVIEQMELFAAKEEA